uniref:Alpha-thujene synthase, chloroplastic n=1 Tax=Litsea cubeba TaxID=155299 RepID=TPS2_LITCU|nr:RecName: Full=Alpha-thujene synthase, chloroplastic; AltName: Full=Terpene synthase 2; Short=LcTPS2; Flags: Precursor [Litsea cubeba]AEJ91555.1 alpha-thujene synthase [Litsea cubeba]
MALQLLTPSFSFQHSPSPHKLTTLRYTHHRIRCTASAPSYSDLVRRRSANYKPSKWDSNFVETLESDYKKENHEMYIEKLMGDVKHLMKEVVNPIEKMELVDTIQRLGLGYLFNKEIKEVLNTITTSKATLKTKKDLHAVALQFRLLRQHGYEVSPDAFHEFKDEKGGFKESLCMDIKGMLCLYEASHLSFQGEVVLDEAREFTSTHLKAIGGNIDPVLLKKVRHSLEMPLHWRMLRLEARWYIETYDEEDRKNPSLAELAKHDFNSVQTIYQRSLKRMSRWWRDLGLGERLEFSRDRLVECFFWTTGVIFDPQFERCRGVLTKVNQLVSTIDDVYDVYGSLEELELFTDAVDRWDIRAMEQLPEYMKICYLALYNTTNDIAYEALKEEGLDVIPYLKKVWTDLCKSYIVEARWYSNGYKPTLEEYLENAWTSIAGPVALVHAYFSFGQKMPFEALNYSNTSSLIKWSSMIFRLCDDLATSSDEVARGDVPKSIQCYMYEAGVSESVARDHIKYLIDEAWKKMNECLVYNTPFLQPLINAGLNLARMAHCMYERGDGHGFSNELDKKRVLLLLAEPFKFM